MTEKSPGRTAFPPLSTNLYLLLLCKPKIARRMVTKCWMLFCEMLMYIFVLHSTLQRLSGL